MPTTLPVRRGPPRRDLGAVICLLLACAPAVLVATIGGRPPIDPEGYAHLDDPARPGAIRLAGDRACQREPGAIAPQASRSSACHPARSRIAVRTARRD